MKKRVIKEDEAKQCICANCSKIVNFEKMVGSFKHPYCEDCFELVWNNNEDKYFEWLAETHHG